MLRKYSAGKYVWHCFEKGLRSWSYSKQSEWLSRCSRSKSVLRNFPKFIRKDLCLSLFYDKVRRCRSATSFKTRLHYTFFFVNFAKFVRTLFLQDTTGRLPLIIAVLIVVKEKLANKIVNYDIEIKIYQFETQV